MSRTFGWLCALTFALSLATFVSAKTDKVTVNRDAPVPVITLDAVPVPVSVSIDENAPSPSFYLDAGSAIKVGPLMVTVDRWRIGLNEDGEVDDSESTSDGPVVMGSVRVGCNGSGDEKCRFTATCCTPPPVVCGGTTDFTIDGGTSATVTCDDARYSVVNIGIGGNPPP